MVCRTLQRICDVDFSPAQVAAPCGGLWSNITRQGNAPHLKTTLPVRNKRGPFWPHPAPPYAMGQEAPEDPRAQTATTDWAGCGRQLWGSWQLSSSCLPSCLGARPRPKCPKGIKGTDGHFHYLNHWWWLFFQQVWVFSEPRWPFNLQKVSAVAAHRLTA